MKNKIDPTDSKNNNTEITQRDFISIGTYLKGQREKKGHSLKFVSEKTRISSSKLELLEKDELKQLPNKAYVTGFVKAYSKYLNINSEGALHCLKETYEKLYPDAIPSGIRILTPEQEMNSRPLGAFLVLGSVFALLITGVYFFMKSNSQDKIRAELRRPIKPQVLTSKSPLKKRLKKENEIKRVPVALAVAPKIVIPKPVVVIPPVKETVKETVKPILANASVKVETPVAVIAQKPIIKVEPKPVPTPVVAKKEMLEEEEKKLRFFNIPGPLYTVDQANSKNLVKKYLPIDVKMSATEGKENVYIRAIEGDSWITYKKDDGPVRKFILRKGRNLFISGGEVRIFLGNLPAIKVFHNNQALKIESKSGVKSLVFPHKNLNKFKLPLFVFKKDGSVTTSDKYLKEKSHL